MFDLSPRVEDLKNKLEGFMDEHIYPNEALFYEQVKQNKWGHPAILEELKEEARNQGLWNLFLPESERGAGLTNEEYAHLCEIMGRVSFAGEVFNCNAPDTGNMETIVRYGNDEHKEKWLKPLLAGEIRSCFSMTEPDVASSDATNIQCEIRREGDEYVINGEKIYVTSGDRADHIVVWATLVSKAMHPESELRTHFFLNAARYGDRVDPSRGCCPRQRFGCSAG